MTAWVKLLAASRRDSGTAWQLISDPKLGGGLIVSDGIAVDLSDSPYEVEFEPMQIDVELSEAAVAVEVADTAIEVEISPETIEVEIQQ